MGASIGNRSKEQDMTKNWNRMAAWLIVALWSQFLVQVVRADEGESAEELSRACFAEVRREMVRREVKMLDPKVQHTVDRLCSLGETERALGFAFPTPDVEDCVLRARKAAESDDGTLGRERISKAYQLCQRGEVDAALAILDGTGEGDPGDEPQVLPEIVSLTSTPTSIRPGQTATVEWRTANADQTFVGQPNPNWPRLSREPILSPRQVGPSGSFEIQPTRTVTYRLEATQAGNTASKDVTVLVTSTPAPPPQAPPDPATCSIAGRLSGELRWDTKDDRGQPISFVLENMYLWAPGADRPIGAAVRGGRYVFKDVPAGKTYRILPGGFRSVPKERSVSCRVGTSHSAVDFQITGPPPSG